jgi:hypothetical protein
VVGQLPIILALVVHSPAFLGVLVADLVALEEVPVVGFDDPQDFGVDGQPDHTEWHQGLLHEADRRFVGHFGDDCQLVEPQLVLLFLGELADGLSGVPGLVAESTLGAGDRRRGTAFGSYFSLGFFEGDGL